MQQARHVHASWSRYGGRLVPRKRKLEQYVEYLWREANARVDARGIPQQWSEPGGQEIAFTHLKTMETGLDKIVQAIADDAIRLGDRNSIAKHLEAGLEVYPEMQEFIIKALRSPRSKFANRPPRQATVSQHLWMARFVALELASSSGKALTQTYEEISKIFGCEPRTVANAYRTYKKWIEFQNDKMIDMLALMVAVMRAHP